MSEFQAGRQRSPEDFFAMHRRLPRKGTMRCRPSQGSSFCMLFETVRAQEARHAKLDLAERAVIIANYILDDSRLLAHDTGDSMLSLPAEIGRTYRQVCETTVSGSWIEEGHWSIINIAADLKDIATRQPLSRPLRLSFMNPEDPKNLQVQYGTSTVTNELREIEIETAATIWQSLVTYMGQCELAFGVPSETLDS